MDILTRNEQGNELCQLLWSFQHLSYRVQPGSSHTSIQHTIFKKVSSMVSIAFHGQTPRDCCEPEMCYSLPQLDPHGTAIQLCSWALVVSKRQECYSRCPGSSQRRHMNQDMTFLIREEQIDMGIEVWFWNWALKVLLLVGHHIPMGTSFFSPNPF